MELSRRHFLGACGATFLSARLAHAQVKNAFEPNRGTLRVALISDTHTNCDNEGEPALYQPRFDAVIEDVNAQKVAFVLHAGDLTEGGKPNVNAEFKTRIAKLNAPQLMVFGNHDIGAKKVAGQSSGLSEERVARFERDFGPSFWVRELSGARIVGVNASLFGSGLERETEQWQFLDETLRKEHDAPFGTHLLTHYPLFLKAADEPSDPYWNIEPAPRARLLALLQKAKVKGVFSGHIHRPLLNTYEQMTLVTAPPVSFGLPRGKQPQGWTLLTIAPHGQITAQVRSIAL